MLLTRLDVSHIFDEHWRATVLSLTLVLILIGCIYLRDRHSKSTWKLIPPGPKGLPLLGSILDWPKGYGWLIFHEWTLKYGDIVHVDMLGSHIIILGQYASAKSVLDRSSASSRPSAPMAGDLIGISSTMILAPLDTHWKSMRRLCHSFTGTQSSLEPFSHIFESGSRELVSAIFSTSSEVWSDWEPLRRCIGEQIIRFIYGFESPSLIHKFTHLAEDVQDRLEYAVIFGSYLVDVFPILKHVPVWFPGAHFKRLAADLRVGVFDMVNLPYQQVMKDIKSPSSPPSITRSMIESDISDLHGTDAVKWAAASLYGAGMEPVYAAMTVFVLAMAFHPEAQAKAQAELDNITGKVRLPVSADRDELPYFRALLKETLRWHPPIPLGVPHYTTSDDFYRGYFIPKGSTIFANLWGIGRDSSVYREPEIFRPERFLGPDAEPSTERWVFGFGRRTCVGQHYASTTLFLYAACILQAFDIVIPDGDTVSPDFSPNTNSFVQPFPVKFIPRVNWLSTINADN